jgi:hypothetical protein
MPGILPEPPRYFLRLRAGNHTAVAQRLIERGADVNLAGPSGVTLGNDTIVEDLLTHGVSSAQ